MLDDNQEAIAEIARELRAIRSTQRRQERAQRFWELWDLSWGVRRDRLQFGLSVAIPLVILGTSRPFLSQEYVWALMAAIFAAWSLFGLMPAFVLRRELILNPSYVQDFMAGSPRIKDAKEFRKRVIRFLGGKLKKPGDRRGLDTLANMEKSFAVFARHAAWVFPTMMVGVLLLVIAAIAGIKWLMART